MWLKILHVHVFALMMSLTSVAAASSTQQPQRVSGIGISSEASEIVWDKWGVPHIYAGSRKEAFYAFGWSQMHAHGELILKLYAQSRGRASVHLGEDYIESDLYVQHMRGPEIAQDWLRRQDGEYGDYLAAFAQGMNDYIEAHPSAIPEDLKSILPIESVDPLMHIVRVILFKFVAGDAYSDIIKEMGLGSNAIAIAPSRSTSGNAMLLANPHLPWSGYFKWFEVQITDPNVDAYGVALVGVPFLSVVITPDLAWTHTVNMFDGVDRYALELLEGGYLLDGKRQAFKTDQLTLDVKLPDGRLIQKNVSRRQSAHGPVVKNDGKDIAVRLVGLGQANVVKQYWDMAQAKDLASFESIISRLQMPFFNTVYADANGEIFFFSGGRQPDRKMGDWATWQGVMPGTDSKFIWKNTLGPDVLPKLRNPRTGFIQNSNDAPWTSTYPFALESSDYSPLVAPSIPPHYRAQRSLIMVSQDSQISFEELDAIRADTHLQTADLFLDELISAAEASQEAKLREAAKILRNWNRRTDVYSRGAPLFIGWLARMNAKFGGDWAEDWDPSAPLTSPNRIKDINGGLAVLNEVVEQLEATHRTASVPYGDVFRIRLAGKDLPASVGYDDFGIFRAGYFRPEKDGTSTLVGGNSFVAIVEFDEKVKAKGILPYGNSSLANSMHFGDQLELFSAGQLRDIYRTRSAVDEHAVRRENVRSASQSTSLKAGSRNQKFKSKIEADF